MSDIQSLLRQLPVLKGTYPPSNFSSFPPDPQGAFVQWLHEAIDHSVPEPHAMTLSTIHHIPPSSPASQQENVKASPDARMLILKNVDDRGWHFAVKSASPKGAQIQSNASVALTFYWIPLARQIRVRGTAVALSEEECRADFDARPLSSKVGALASTQSETSLDREELKRRIGEERERAEREGEEALKCPGWTVYAVVPESVEFWQGRGDRLHERLRYDLDADKGSWAKSWLWP